MIKIVTWNMCYWKLCSIFSDSWKFLSENINPDVGMVQETIPPKTPGSLKNFVWEKIGGKRNWGTGIFSKYNVDKIEFGNAYSGFVTAGEVSK